MRGLERPAAAEAGIRGTGREFLARVRAHAAAAVANALHTALIRTSRQTTGAVLIAQAFDTTLLGTGGTNSRAITVRFAFDTKVGATIRSACRALSIHIALSSDALLAIDLR